MDRKSARAHAMKLIYEWDMGGDGGEDTRMNLLGVTPGERESEYMNRMFEGVVANEEELDECIPSVSDVEREVECRELASAMAAFIDSLPEPERQVFVSRYWYLAPVDEIAEKFGFSRSKTASMLYRCRNRLQKFLQQEGLC